MQEPEILARISAGDTEQFGLLYDAYAERIYKYLFYRTRDREVAEDLTSTTFFKAIQNIKRFDASKGNFSSWIYRIARNTLFDYYRQKKITEPIEVAEEMNNSEDIEGEIGDRELLRGIKKSFAQLTSDQREIVTMRIWDGLTYSEIAKALGKSEASCKVAFYRATIKLKKFAPLAMAFFVLFSSFNKFI
jgi:RNA polymerase sigma-70 factor (ECF subfamily)